MNTTHVTKQELCVLAIFALSLLALCHNVGAAAADDPFKNGARYEKERQFFKAAESYARVLRLKPGDQKARTALARVGDRAVSEKLSIASELEAELKLDEAVAALDAARRLQDQMLTLKVGADQGSHIDSMRKRLVTRRVEALLAEADRAHADGLWSAAVAHLQQVEVLLPDFNDTRKRLHDVWVAWGEANVDEGRLRAAAERFEQAAGVPGWGSGPSGRRAAAIWAGLGNSVLARGACRGALADFRAAERLAPGSVGPDALKQAAACAETCVQLKVIADPESGLGEGQFDLLGAEVRKQINTGASEFLKLRSSSSNDARECNSRTLPGVDGQPMIVGPYSAAIRVTAITVIRQSASASTRQARPQLGGPVDMIVTYEEYQEPFIGTISGWVTVTDKGSPGLSVPLPVKITRQTLARWQRNPISSATATDYRSGRTSTVVMIDGSNRGKAQAEDERRQARLGLTEALVLDFASEAARLLLSIVDVEPAVPDPTALPGVQASGAGE